MPFSFIVGGDACTSGFPERDRLVSDIKVQTGSAIRLIPEMSFVCNGTISGYTVAQMRRGSGREQHPAIQIWRRNSSECQSTVYYKVGDAISIDDNYCRPKNQAIPSSLSASTQSERNMIFSCQLDDSFHVAVQSGDILGLELPTKNAETSALLFAVVFNGPTNYVFKYAQGQFPSLSRAVLTNEVTTNQELPQITFEFESGTII